MFTWNRRYDAAFIQMAYLIMMSHMGKPKGKVKPELSLSQIVKNVSDALGVEVKFAKECGTP